MKPSRSSVQLVVLGGVARVLPVLATAFALAGPSTSSFAVEVEPPHTPDAAQAQQLASLYVEKYVARTRFETHNALLTRLLEPAHSVTEPAWLVDLARTDPELRRALSNMLEAGVRPLVRDVAEAAATLRARRESLQQDWLSIRSSLYENRMFSFEIKAGQRVAGRLAWLLSVDKRWFWLFGLVAVAALGSVVFHDRRREFRQWLHGGRARAAGLPKLLLVALFVLAGLTLVTFFLGDRLFDALASAGEANETSPRAEIETQIAAMDAELAKLRETGRELDRRAVAAESGGPIATGATPAAAALAGQSRQFRLSAIEAREEWALLDKLAAAIASDRDELRLIGEQLAVLAEERGNHLRLREGLRGGLGCALLGLVTLGACLFRRGVRRRREATANTCPLCLGRGHLETVPDAADGHGDLAVLRCKNVISQNPYEQCDYSFMSAYRQTPKLCFPTLGVPQAGKTHWLAMLYWELNRGNYPRAVQFEKVRSRSSEDFDVLVEEILRSRLGTAATQRDRIPHPLVFSFRDHDRWGRANVLVNIFDYSGEVTADMGLDDYRRRRALAGDGFLFFLDPTFPSEPQAKALADFREDLRLVKGVKTGQPISVPVALCVSKIDILAGHSYALPDGSDPIARFYEELGQIDPTGEAVSLRVIEARSRLTARLRDTIWPGWQIERQVRDLFGGRYMFFPLTPVGLDGVGETDLSLRTISPFGLLEPLVWLLEMNGYPVLE